MSIPELQGPELKPFSGEKAKQLVVLLHGLGADGNDLISLAPMLAEHFPDAHFVSPNAPEPCDMAPMGYQWFSLQERTHERMLAGVQRAFPILNQYLDNKLEELDLSDSDLALIGFSQGTMMSLYTAPRRPNPCAAIIGFSGALIGTEDLTSGVKSRPPVCLIHGNADMVVPFDAMGHAEHHLAEAGIPVETHGRPGLGHGIDPDGLNTAIAFLKTHMG